MKKITIILGLVALFAAVLFSQSINFKDNVNVLTMKGEDNIQYEMKSSFPVLNDTAKVYVTKTPKVSNKYVTEIGNKFGIINSSSEDTDLGTFSLFNGEKHLIVYKNSGAVWYSMPAKMEPVVTVQPNLPSTDVATKIATDFLVSTDSLPKDAEFSDVVADQQITGEKETGKITQIYNVTLQVRYRREINGMPVVGPGNKLKVFIGDNNEIVGLFKVWRDFEPYTEVKIKTPEQAYSDLLASKDVVPMRIEGDKVIIKDITFGYWMEAADKDQEYVLPVYIFKGDVINSNTGYMGQYEGYVYATEDGRLP